MLENVSTEDDIVRMRFGGNVFVVDIESVDSAVVISGPLDRYLGDITTMDRNGVLFVEKGAHRSVSTSQVEDVIAVFNHAFEQIHCCSDPGFLRNSVLLWLPRFPAFFVYISLVFHQAMLLLWAYNGWGHREWKLPADSSPSVGDNV